MTRAYSKKPLSVDEQLGRLETRGVVFRNRVAAKHVLANTNYYRLSGYWHIFKTADETFRRADAFDLAVQLHALDLELRKLVLEMTSRLEVTFRSRVAYQLAINHGTFAHEKDEAWAQQGRNWRTAVRDWRERLHRETKRSTDSFAKHFEREYEEWPKLPVWVACEIMSFGTLSRLFKGMTTEDRSAVAQPFSIHHKVLASWLHMLSYTRNIAAHQGRLWNRTFSIKGMLPRTGIWQDLGLGRQIDRAYGALCALRHLSRKIDVDVSDQWAHQVMKLMDRFPTAVGGVTRLGAPQDWRNRTDLWQAAKAE